MKAFSVALALAGLSSVFAAQPNITFERKANFPNYVEGKVIVELSSTSSLIGKREDVHARFFAELDKRFSSDAWSHKRIFDSPVFTGASLTLKSTDDIAKLRSIAGVKAVRPVKILKAPKVRAEVSVPKVVSPANPTKPYAPIAMTGVDKVHASGNKGKGIKIGIIDTGIDYTHPALGGKFGPGHKVAGGYDFVGDDYPLDPQPDNDPLDQCAGHGTHVAGIIGANPGNAQGVVGVAYEASLYAYRVFGCQSQVDDDIAVAALLRAFSDGCDVLTLSLGSMDGWSESTTSVIASRVAEHGRVVTVSVGNGGDDTGAWTAESPAGGINVIAVGSVNVPDMEQGGLVSNFTSYGPSYDMFFKPAVSAPGGGIMSLWPVKMGAYKMLSGTSMSTPHVAGVAALIMNAKGKGAYRRMRDLLETTSTWVPQSKAKNAPPHTLAQQGAGLVNAYAAINYKTVVAPGELLLNDTAHWKTWHTVFVTNNDKAARTYTLKHVPAGTANTLFPGSVQVAQYPVPQDNKVAASVHIAQPKITVQPGATVPVAVAINPPTNANAKLLPIVSGFIEVSSDSKETLRVAYMGAATSLKDISVLDTTPEVLGAATPVLMSGPGQVQTGARNYTWQGSDYPMLTTRLAFGTAALRVDLVKPDFKLPKRGLALDARGLSAPISWWRPDSSNGAKSSLVAGGGSFDKVPILGTLFEHDYISRNDINNVRMYQSIVPNVFADGKPVPHGQYRALLRALKVGGDPAQEADYKVWLSPPFGYVGK